MILHRTQFEPYRSGLDHSRHIHPAFIALKDEIVVDYTFAKAAPRWKGTQWIYPQSELIAYDMQELIGHLIGLDEDIKRAFFQAEYRMALAHAFLTGEQSMPSAGKYLGTVRTRLSGDKNFWRKDFELHGDHQAWNWSPSPDGEPDPIATKLDELDTVLARSERW